MWAFLCDTLPSFMSFHPQTQLLYLFRNIPTHTRKDEPLFQKCDEEEVEGIKLLDNMVR